MASFEIEQKFRIADPPLLVAALTDLQASLCATEVHVDTYLRHPSRDFALTGEALRVRQVNDELVFTYKGPKELGPVKIRPELELPVKATVEQWLSFWNYLGFQVADQVYKTRRIFRFSDRDHVLVCLDDVRELGDFVEIEIVTEESGKDAAASEIVALANQLGLRDLEPRSYLRQIIEKKSVT